MRTRDEKLDLIRGGSALLVLIGHARNFLMVDAAGVSNPSIGSKAFYLVTSLHHPAVMVFFVLSGYFVGGSVLSAIRQQRFSWFNYSLARLSRLWVVLLPALVLTLAIDWIGLRLAPGAYRGEYHALFNSGPTLSTAIDHGLLTFLGNLGFLQTIQMPVFGTNGPLWSLAYEFWYYALFPLALAALPSRKDQWFPRICCWILILCLLWILPAPLLLSGLIWLMGVAVWRVSKIEVVKRAANSWLWKWGGGAIFAVALVGTKLVTIQGSDFIVGAAFALWMPALLGQWTRQGWWSRASLGLSEISFSLYIIHFPIQFFVVGVLLGGTLYQPSASGLAWFVCLNVACIFVSILFWWLFERRTACVRKWVSGVLIKSLPQFIKERGSN